MLYETFETEKHLVFVTELCSGGDLLSYVRRRRKLSEEMSKIIFKQILLGLQHIHSKGILHRDIKLENILLDKNGVVKIADFGVSHPNVVIDQRMFDSCGTPAYIAPEMILKKGYFNFTVDLWSSGVVLYALLNGTIPFRSNDISDLNTAILTADYTFINPNISDECIDLISKLLDPNPLTRFTVK